MNRRAGEAVRLRVEPVEEVVELGDHPAGPAGRAEPLGICLRQQRLVRDVEADHRHVHAAREDPGGRLRVGPDVELRRRRDVAEPDRAAHQDDSVRPRVGVAGEQQRDVRQRPDGDQRRARGVPAEEVDGVLLERRPLRRRQVGAVEPGLTVDVRGDERLADERPVGARRDRDVVAADEVEDADRVRGRLLERLVAGDGRHAEELHLGAREREEQRDRVVVAGVAVEQDPLSQGRVDLGRRRQRRLGAEPRGRDRARGTRAPQRLVPVPPFEMGDDEAGREGVARRRAVDSVDRGGSARAISSPRSSSTAPSGPSVSATSRGSVAALVLVAVDDQQIRPLDQLARAPASPGQR